MGTGAGQSDGEKKINLINLDLTPFMHRLSMLTALSICIADDDEYLIQPPFIMQVYQTAPSVEQLQT
ncbi:MAG: hypothetical protein ACI84K_001424 [Pseudohongiellaceae bacterium]|jgi:hypothetical protein